MLDKLGSIKFNNLNFSVNKILFKVIFLKENDKISLKFNILKLNGNFKNILFLVNIFDFSLYGKRDKRSKLPTMRAVFKTKSGLNPL